MIRAEQIHEGRLDEKTYDFEVGDTVDVHVQITEGDKTRVQVFSGTVIRIKGGGVHKTFTVRRIVQGEGVERIFPYNAPTVVDVKTKKKGVVRRAKLYYLRDRVGKGTRVKERTWIPAKKKKKKKAAPAPKTDD